MPLLGSWLCLGSGDAWIRGEHSNGSSCARITGDLLIVALRLVFTRPDLLPSPQERNDPDSVRVSGSRVQKRVVG